MEDLGFAQLTCLMLGGKLKRLSALPEEQAAKELLSVAKEVREALITLGSRKRKVRKPKPEGTEPKSRKGGKGGK